MMGYDEATQANPLLLSLADAPLRRLWRRNNANERDRARLQVARARLLIQRARATVNLSARFRNARRSKARARPGASQARPRGQGRLRSRSGSGQRGRLFDGHVTFHKRVPTKPEPRKGTSGKPEPRRLLVRRARGEAGAPPARSPVYPESALRSVWARRRVPPQRTRRASSGGPLFRCRPAYGAQEKRGAKPPPLPHRQQNRAATTRDTWGDKRGFAACDGRRGGRAGSGAFRRSWQLVQSLPSRCSAPRR